MKNKVILMGLCLLLISALLIPVAAQESGPGEGGTVIIPNIGGDPSSFNPLISSDTVSSTSWAYLYPPLFTLNPETAVSEPGQPGALASGWSFDETGTVATITLRQDLTWNDGTPITAADYLWAVEAVRSGETSSPRTYVFETLADGTPSGGAVVSVEATDDYTIVVTFNTADCAAFEDLNDIYPVPSHIFDPLYGANYAQMDAEPRRIPTVTYGPFKDLEFSPDERVSLIADQAYLDAILGFVSPGEWIYKRVTNTTVAFEQLLAGELTWDSVAPERQNELRDNPDFQIFEFSQNGFTYMGYNLADPTNPQNGLDADGNVIDQGNHPIFGDVRVRRAIAHATDIDAMIAGILDGNGTRVNTHAIPTSWTFDPDLAPYAYDPELALSILAEAGWVDHDNDVTTPLVCDGCLYAEPGTPLEFELITNAGNLARERFGQAIQSQLAEIGIQVNFSAIDFGVLVQNIQAQAGDAFIIGWALGLPVDPDVTSFYTAQADQVGAGFAFTSYNNEELNSLLEQGRTVPGCAVEDRLPFYQQVNQILYDDQPYLYLFAGNVMYAAANSVQNWSPYPNFATWNIDSWSVE